jgi:hypothetical protein
MDPKDDYQELRNCLSELEELFDLVGKGEVSKREEKKMGDLKEKTAVEFYNLLLKERVVDVYDVLGRKGHLPPNLFVFEYYGFLTPLTHIVAQKRAKGKITNTEYGKFCEKIVIISRLETSRLNRELDFFTYIDMFRCNVDTLLKTTYFQEYIETRSKNGIKFVTVGK